MSPKKQSPKNKNHSSPTQPEIIVADQTSDAMMEDIALATAHAGDADLEADASEWSEDPVRKDRESESTSTTVTFVSNPSGLNQTLDVAAAQKDEEFEIDDSELDEVADAETLETEAQALAVDSAPESEAADEEAAEELTEAQALALEAEALKREAAELEASEDEILEEMNSADGPTHGIDALGSLQAKIEAQEKIAAQEAQAMQDRVDEENSKLLAEQIAEDEALEKAMKDEAEGVVIDPELLAALPRHPVEGDDGHLDLQELESCIEALLFMVDKPMSSARIKELLGDTISLELYDEAIERLQKRYSRLCHGIELAHVAKGYQFRTKPVRAALAKKLAKVTTQRLSTGAMETLAIVAYKQPCLKEDIDQVRGVDSSHFIRGLLDKKLIKISGRSELPGRPMLYATTSEFLEVFGLKDLNSMPALRELESMIPTSQAGENEDPRVKEMRRLVGEMKSDNSTSLLYDPGEDEAFLKDIRDRVKGIDITTATLVAQDEEKKNKDRAIAEGTYDPNAEAMSNAAPGETPELPNQ